MAIEIASVGGYNEVGKNMTAIRVGSEVVIVDMGIHLENYIRLTEDEDIIKLSTRDLTSAGAIPDITPINDWMPKVQAIATTHAHLDHIGAIPFLGNKFRAPVYGTPFSIEVLKSILKDEKIDIKNKLNDVKINGTVKLTPNIKMEFINTTHSTPHTVMIALHTRYGSIIYANDFKFDNYPTLGQKPNLKRLEELGRQGAVHTLIVDSTYAWDWRKMPSETVAKNMLRDVILATDSRGKAIVVTTFSSHIARLRSIVEFGQKLGRKIVFMGRSLSKYCEAAKKAGIADLSEHVEIVKFSRKIKKRLTEISKDRDKYLIVMTGHQGEPKAALSKIIDGVFPFKFEPEDHVIFSCTVIPTETNYNNRNRMEQRLKSYGVRIFKDLHVSGHAAREDLRDLINMLKPKNIIPAHGNFKMTTALVDLAQDMGYKNENIHLIQNGERLKF